MKKATLTEIRLKGFDGKIKFTKESVEGDGTFVLIGEGEGKETLFHKKIAELKEKLNKKKEGKL